MNPSGGPSQRFRGRGPGPRFGQAGFNGGSRGQSSGNAPPGDVTATVDRSLSFHLPAPSASMQSTGYGSTGQCTECCTMGAELRRISNERDGISERYACLSEDYQKCCNYKEECEKLQKALDEKSQKCAQLERLLKLQESHETHPESVKKVQAPDSKNKGNKEHENPKEVVTNAKATRKTHSRFNEDTCHPNKRPEKNRVVGNESHPFQRDEGNESCSVSDINRKEEGAKEHFSLGRGSNSVGNRNRPSNKREDNRQPKSWRVVGNESHPFQRDEGNESCSVSDVNMKEEGAEEHSLLGGGSNSVGNQNRSSNKREDNRQPKSWVNIKEIQGDLFKGTEEYSLAHCVGSDFIMSSGIAIEFRKQFRRIGELLEQNKKPGEVAFLPAKDNRFIYYLVTKQYSTGKPTWDDFTKAVRNLRELCVSHNVKHLAMPRIGCGLDLLRWSEVREVIKNEFAGTDIEICVYRKEAEQKTDQQRWNLKFFNHHAPFSEIDPQQCAIIFFGSTDGHVTPQMEELDKRFRFLHHYKAASRAIGGLYMYECPQAKLFGFMLKNSHKDDISFPLMNGCFIKLKKLMKQNHLYYIGLEAFEDPKHDIVMHKIWTLLIDVCFIDDYEVHFYWPDGVQEGWYEGRC